MENQEQQAAENYDVNTAEAQAAVQVKANLDSLVISIELTLISIIQGAALAVLFSSAIDPVINLKFEYWPYIVVGLTTILIFWSRSLVHTLTFISWPLDFKHNFLYIGSTLIEALALTQVTDPSNWFAILTAYSCVILILYYADLVMIKQYDYDFRGPIARKLYKDILEDQELNVRFLMPASIIFHFLAWVVINRWPDIFIDGHWHVAIGIYQILVGIFYLRQVMPILERRQGWVFQRLVQQATGVNILFKKDEKGLDIIG
ncbi:MAG: hypothetical protein EXR62_11765 [Chloroflexi bacterium]|nr:hypothetical protein [Chloroflexota bacterium]